MNFKLDQSNALLERDDILAIVFSGLSVIYAMLALNFLLLSRRYDNIVTHLGQDEKFASYLNAKTKGVIMAYGGGIVWTLLEVAIFILPACLFIAFGIAIARSHGEQYTRWICLFLLIVDLFAAYGILHAWARGRKVQSWLHQSRLPLIWRARVAQWLEERWGPIIIAAVTGLAVVLWVSCLLFLSGKTTGWAQGIALGELDP